MTNTNPSEETRIKRQPGRPKKGQSLTDFLNKVFEEDREVPAYDEEGRPCGTRIVTTKEIVAEYVRGAVTKGEVELVTGEKYKFTSETWLDLVKWAYNRMDGNPVTPIDADTTTHLVFDAVPTVEMDYLPDPNVVVVEALDVTNEMVRTVPAISKAD
jgi:hypothetical protein